MRISDWSSDVCSSDLTAHGKRHLLQLCPVLPMSASANKVRAHRSPRGRGGRAFRSDGTGYGEMRQDTRQVRNRRLRPRRSEEHTSELRPQMRIADDVFCLKQIIKSVTTGYIVGSIL